MRNSFILIIIVLIVSCSVNKPIVILNGIDRTKYPGDPRMKVIERYYDYIPEKQMPKILLDYYSSLKSDCFRKIELRFDTAKSSLEYYPVHTMSFSKKAKDGYLQINKYVMDSLHLQQPFKYIINADTVNSERMINKLLSLRKSSINSINIANGNIVIIKTN